MTMLRDINRVVDGKLDSTDARVGVLASEIPTGFPLSAFLLNDIDSAYPNRMYSVEVLTLPGLGKLYLNKAGVGYFEGAPAGTYSGTQRINKYDPGVGIVSSAVGDYNLQIGSVPSSISSVTVSPEAVTIGDGQGYTFTVMVEGTGAFNQAVIWSTTTGAIDGAGNLVLGSTNVQRTLIVTATSVQDPTKSGSSTVTQMAPGNSSAPVVNSVSVQPFAPTLAGGATQQFSATVHGVSNPSQAVTWMSTIGQINAGGLFIAPDSTEELQMGTVTAISVQDNTKSGSTVVSVATVGEEPAPPVIVGINGPRSKARTFVVSDPQVRQDTSTGVGTFWDLSNPAKPKGVKDPSAVIDISWDWGPWFEEAGDSYGSHYIVVDSGLILRATNEDDSIISAFVDRGHLGKTVGVTCHIKSNSTPPREDERTLYLRIRDR